MLYPVRFFKRLINPTSGCVSIFASPSIVDALSYPTLGQRGLIQNKATRNASFRAVSSQPSIRIHSRTSILGGDIRPKVSSGEPRLSSTSCNSSPSSVSSNKAPPRKSRFLISTCHDVFRNLALEDWIYNNEDFADQGILRRGNLIRN